MDFLTDYLGGERQPAEDVKRAATKLNISGATLRRAKKQLGVEVEREGFGRDGTWYWSLPEETVTDEATDRGQSATAIDAHQNTVNTNDGMSMYGERDNKCIESGVAEWRL